MITYKWDLVEREFNPPVVANKSSFIVYSSIINQVSRSWSMLSASKSNTQMHISRGFKVFSKQFLGNPIKGIKVDTCIWNLVVKVNRTSRKVPSYTCLKLRSFFKSQNFVELLLGLQLPLNHQCKTHRLDKTEKHHTSIRTSMHSKHTRLEQYTNQWKDSKSNLHIATITHTRKAH